MITGAIVGV